MKLYKHLKIDIDKEQPEYNEYSFMFKLIPNLSVECEKEYGVQDYLLVRIEWLIWSTVLYHKDNRRKENGRIG